MLTGIAIYNREREREREGGEEGQSIRCGQYYRYMFLTLLFPVGKIDLRVSLSSFNCLNSVSSCVWAVGEVSRSLTISSLKD